MITPPKTSIKLVTLTSLVVLILGSSVLWAQNIVFNEFNINELKVIQVMPEDQAVLLEAPNGDTEVLGIGDIVGFGEYEIIEVQSLLIILESLPDNSGMTSKKCIPVGGPLV